MIARRRIMDHLQKPYAKAAWGFFLFFVVSFLLHPTPLADLYLAADSDDFMRLARVRDWMSGAGWYEISPAHLGWDGTSRVPWSRLVDLPIAFLASLLKPLVGLTRALEITGLVFPVLLLVLGLMPVVAMMTRLFVGRQQSMLGVVVLFALGFPLLYQYVPTRVDHHGYQLILTGLTFGLLLRLVCVPVSSRAPVWAALAFALGLWIGGEIIPALILFCFCLGVKGSWSGGFALRHGAVFGAWLAAFALLVWPIARPVWRGDDFSLTWFSGAYVLFAVLAGVSLVSLGCVGRMTQRRWLRMAFAVAAGLFGGAQYLFFVPEVLEGPYGTLSQDAAKLILSNVTEAQPLYATLIEHKGNLKDLLIVAGVLLGPVTALVAACWQVFCASPRRQWIALASALYLLVFVAGSIFWQFRLFPFAQLVAIPVLAALVQRWMRRLSLGSQGRTLYWKKAFAFLTLTFLPTVFLPALLLQKPVYPDNLLFFTRARPPACDMRKAWAFMADPSGLGAQPLRAANMLNEGAGLLFHTPHFVMSAPYLVTSNESSLKFFTASESEAAHYIARQEKLDIVVLCRKIPRFYAGAKINADVDAQDPLRLALSHRSDKPTLAEHLLHGKPPVWLEEVEGFADPDVLIYRVRIEGKGRS